MGNSRIPKKVILYHPFGIGIGTNIVFGISVPKSIADSTEIPKYRISFGTPSSVNLWLYGKRLIQKEEAVTHLCNLHSLLVTLCSNKPLRKIRMLYFRLLQMTDIYPSMTLK